MDTDQQNKFPLYLILSRESHAVYTYHPSTFYRSHCERGVKETMSRKGNCNFCFCVCIHGDVKKGTMGVLHNPSRVKCTCNLISCLRARVCVCVGAGVPACACVHAHADVLECA